jgi:ABC-type glycerol-3-phosphate transport system substrate-binding protein
VATAATAAFTRRTVLGTLASLGAAGVLAACGGPSPAAQGGSGDVAKPAPSGPQKVDVWWSIADNNPSIAPAWDDFKKRHAGWTGELTMGVPYDKFQASLAGGIVPDAYFGSFQVIQAAAFKKIVAPLDPYISRDKVNMDQYYFGSKAGAVFKGKVYGMPHHSNVRSLYVNQQAYREVGVDPTRAPATWDDLRAINQRMKGESAPGVLERIGYNPTWQIGGPTAVMYFQANDVPLVSADGNQPAFATPPASRRSSGSPIRSPHWAARAR